MTRPVRVVPLYPELLSIYADRGNVRVLEQRARWRGVPVEVAPVALGEDVDPGASDLILIGGGQDRDQVLVAEEFLRQTPALRAALDDGAALLAVCGGYQLLGHRYRGHQGDEIPGTGLVDLETLAGDARSIGNVVVDCDLPGCGPQRLVGFRTTPGARACGAGVAPLGRVAHGGGNNGEDGGEGCVQEHRRHVRARPAPAEEPVARRPAPALGVRARGRRRGARVRAARRRPRAARRRARGRGRVRRATLTAGR